MRKIMGFGGLGVLTLLAVVTWAPPAVALQGGPSGEQLFRQRCAACHSVVAGQPDRLGPNLSGISGRRAGTTGYSYSPAMRASALNWDRATLDRYLAAPTRTVPGTRMVIAVSDARQRAAIIDYLLQARSAAR
jgi:cytochrome c